MYIWKFHQNEKNNNNSNNGLVCLSSGARHAVHGAKASTKENISCDNSMLRSYVCVCLNRSCLCVFFACRFRSSSFSHFQFSYGTVLKNSIYINYCRAIIIDVRICLLKKHTQRIRKRWNHSATKNNHTMHRE